MKILLATYWPVPHVGGVWPFMLKLKAKLEALGHQVDLMGTGDDEEKSYVYIVNENRRIAKSHFIPLLNAKLDKTLYPTLHVNKLVRYAEFQRYFYELSAAYLGLDKYDLIHTHDVISTSCISRVRPKSAALVATLHGCVAHEIRHQLKTIHRSDTNHIAKAFYDELEYLGATSAEYTHVANEWLRNILTEEFHVPQEQIHVFQYGFDIDEFYSKMAIPAKITRPEGKKVIVYTGRLVELKGIQYLIDALGMLKEKRSDWVCWIVGSGDKLAQLRVQSKANGLEADIQFLGKQDNIPALLGESDIFVLPSIVENQPLALIEAQLAGVAAVVSDVGGLPEMVQHKMTGLLTPVGDAERLSRQLNLLLSKEEYRLKLAENAKQWALSHWTMEAMMTRISNLYEDALAKRREVIAHD